MNTASGFQEIEHTADWALKVWAPDMKSLLQTAAQGMNALAEVQLEFHQPVTRSVELEAFDRESLLVTFLSELLYLQEQEWIAFDRFEISLDGYHLKATLTGGSIQSLKKEIKAVTYHELAVVETEIGLEVVVVFDV